MNEKASNLRHVGRIPEAQEAGVTPDSVRRKLIEAEKRNPNAAKIRIRLGLPPLAEL